VYLSESSQQCRNRTRWGGRKETGVRSAWRSAFRVTWTKTHRSCQRPPPGCSSGSLCHPSFPSFSSSLPCGDLSPSPCHVLPSPSWPNCDCASGEWSSTMSPVVNYYLRSHRSVGIGPRMEADYPREVHGSSISRWSLYSCTVLERAS